MNSERIKCEGDLPAIAYDDRRPPYLWLIYAPLRHFWLPIDKGTEEMPRKLWKYKEKAAINVGQRRGYHNYTFSGRTTILAPYGRQTPTRLPYLPGCLQGGRYGNATISLMTREYLYHGPPSGVIGHCHPVGSVKMLHG